MGSIHEKIQAAMPRNTELLRTLGETDYAEDALKQQEVYIADCQNQMQDLDKRIQQLEQNRLKELKDHEKYRDSVMKRFAYKVGRKEAKFQEKASKEEREYFDALQEEHKQKEVRKNLVSTIAEAQSAKTELEATRSRHKQAQRELDEMYDDIFEGPSPGFPDEDAKEQAAHQCLDTYHTTSVRFESEKQVFTLLNKAHSRMGLAKNHLADARRHSQMDMFGGGAITDMMERSALNKAEVATTEAINLVEQARRLSPEVHSLPPVSIAQGNLMSDMFFDNIFTDMAFHEKIKQSQAEQERAAQDLGQQAAAAKQRCDSLSEQVRKLGRDVEKSRVELQQIRSQAFANK